MTKVDNYVWIYYACTNTRVSTRTHHASFYSFMFSHIAVNIPKRPALIANPWCFDWNGVMHRWIHAGMWHDDCHAGNTKKLLPIIASKSVMGKLFYIFRTILHSSFFHIPIPCLIPCSLLFLIVQRPLRTKLGSSDSSRKRFKANFSQT